MASVADLDAEVAAALELLAQITTRADSDWRRDRQPVASSTATYQLRVWRMIEDNIHSGETWKRIRVEVDVHQLAPTQADERTLLISTYDAVLVSLLDRGYWNAMSSVYKVVDDGDEFPSVETEPELDVRVLSFGVAVELWLQE